MPEVAAHLLMPSQVMISAFPYAANWHNDIATSGSDYSHRD